MNTPTRETATILAALRYWQQDQTRPKTEGRSQELMDIASDNGGFESLSALEIDDLCEHLNFGDLLDESECPKLARLLTAAEAVLEQSKHRRPLTNEQHLVLYKAVEAAEAPGGAIGPDLLRQLLECPATPRAGGATAILVDAPLMADIRSAVHPGKIS